jgi:SAM-dependent methyltransferase
MLRAGSLPGMAQADMRRLPLADRSVHAVWCHAALLHVPRHDVPTVLAEFARVIRPGGTLSLGVAEGDGEGWEDSTYSAGGRRWYVYHRHDDLVDALGTHGLTVQTTRRRTAHRAWLTPYAHRTTT